MKFDLCRIALLFFIASVPLAAAPAPKTEMTVQLPPFIIEQPAIAKWRYTEIPRFEILSRCSDITTDRLVHSFHRANQLLGLLLPERFQMAMDVPQALIFYDEKLWSPAEREAVTAMLFGNRSAQPKPGAAPDAARVPVDSIVGFQLRATEKPAVNPRDCFYNNLMLADVDSMTTFALASDATIDPNETYLTPDYVYSLLNGRVPALPEWFVAGFLGLYRSMEFHGNTVSLVSTRWDTEPGGGGKERKPAAFLPWTDFFTLNSPNRAEHPTLWATQGMAFVQWGIDPAAGHADAFWKFVDRAAVEPDVAKAFQEAFGFDFDEASRQLGPYLLTARPVRWTLTDEQARPPNNPIEDASPRQIARIKGEWEQLETRYVRNNYPDLEAQYLAQARRTLHKAYDKGDRDPRLLATLGLLELGANERATAQGFLDEAVRGSVVRPRACFELARLRYNHEFGRSRRDDGKFTSEQTAAIAAPLLLATRQDPPLPQVYELLKRVYAKSVDAPPPEVVSALAEGRKYFPQGTDVAERTLKPQWSEP